MEKSVGNPWTFHELHGQRHTMSYLSPIFVFQHACMPVCMCVYVCVCVSVWVCTHAVLHSEMAGADMRACSVMMLL